MARDITRRRNRVPADRLLALAVGAMAVGAVAIGAMAIGQIAIGRLAIKRARFGSLEVDELTVGKLHVREHQSSKRGPPHLNRRGGQARPRSVPRPLTNSRLPANLRCRLRPRRQ